MNSTAETKVVGDTTLFATIRKHSLTVLAQILVLHYKFMVNR